MTKVGIKIVSICSLFLFILACSDEDKNSPTENGKPSFVFNMPATTRAVIDNAMVYLFDGGTWNYKKKATGVNYETDKITMTVDAGTWDIGLVTANTDITTDIISPVRNQSRTDSKLWETKPVSDNLPSVPEIRTAFLESQTVLANQANTASEIAMLDRNVALVKVVIEDANGLVTTGGTHYFDMTKVPTTINWTGGLYPDKDTPDYSTSPMKRQFTVSDHPTETGRQISDTLMFIIPAHKGNDYFNTTPSDTTTHHLTFNIDLECDGTGRFKKENVEISLVPKVNRILLVRLYVGGKLEVTSEILGWKDIDLEADFSQTLLHVDRASVGLAHKDTIYVNTNADDFTVSKDPGAEWLSAQRIGNTNGIEITADTDTYTDNQPRDSYITIKANNVTKKIPVTQRPDRGTISVDAKALFMSPPNPAKSLNVTSIGGDWKIIGSTLKAEPSATTGNAGTSPVSFTRKTTSDEDYFPRVYGDTIVVFKNTRTLDTDTVRLSNLFIGIEDGLIEVDQPTVQPDTTSYINNVKVFGGNTRNLVILDKPDWVHAAPETYYDPLTGIFTFVCDREPNEEERYGEITLMHADDHDYIVNVRILQDIIIRINFDYFVVQFKWTQSDVDIKVGFTGNPTSVDVDGVIFPTTSVSAFQDKFVGFNASADPGGYMNTTIYYDNDILLQWGGDAQDGEGETAFFNAPVLDTAPYPGQYGVTPQTQGILPRILKYEVNAAWWNSRKNIPMTCTVFAYEGGYMQKAADGKNYDNIGGTRVDFPNSRQDFDVTKIVSHSNRDFEHICDVVYDRKKHKATIEWKGRPWGTRSVTRIRPATNEGNEPKSHFGPNVIYTYSNGFKGVRK